MNQNSESRVKRKQSSTLPNDRPSKQHKPERDTPEMNGDGYSPANGVPHDTDMDYDSDELPVLSRVPTAADTAEWQATIERVVKNVVSIHFCVTCSFDTDPATTSEATGFVVDAERGYILTNRHVVGPGPFWGYCIFDNHEECDVHPVYRDPVHDFGILRFDPKKIKYMSVAALELRPDLARIGAEIRVVGNDAGEKLSILSGVISRLDRNAPEYGEGYSDFNTNYIQAAAAASGGSSGSPVVNKDGFAVALQAGGRADGAATDYFLPLDRPLRALQCIQQGKPVARGTIQTQWLLKPFDECGRLGLSSHWVDVVRKNFPRETNMLVAEVVLPKGPADAKIEEGDILIKVNGELLTQFVKLDNILDSSVGEKTNLLLQRGGEEIEVELDVGDLHAITPDRFVTVAGASFHDLSYQQARLYAIALKDPGVYICEAAGSFRFDGSESGWLVQSIDNKPTPDLDTFIEVMKEIPDRARVVIGYKHLRDLHTLHTSILLIDRHWTSKMRLAKRNDVTGLWDFTDIADALPPVPRTPKSGKFTSMHNAKYPEAVDIIRSFVTVSASMPVKLDGFPRARKMGHGLVLDAEKGLVLISRAIVPYDLCDISITIAGSVIVDGKIIFMHPLQNFAIIQYDSSLAQVPVKTPKLSSEHVRQCEDLIFFGFNQNHRPVVGNTEVTDITTVAIPASASTPRYRATNLDAVTVDTRLASDCGSGVLVDKDGTVHALWLTYLGERNHNGKDMEYHLGLASPVILPILKQIQDGVQPKLRILSVEFQTISMSQARIMGIGEAWIDRVYAEDQERHQFFMVRKVDSGQQGNGGLQEGDVLLTLNDKLITRVSHLDIQYSHDQLDAVVLRKRAEVGLSLSTIPTEDVETARAVLFCGAVLHAPHHAVRQQISRIHSDVYVSGRMRGSPAYMYGLAPTNFLTHVNGAATPDLEAFLREVKKIPDNTYFRLKVMTFDNVPWVATMKKNEHYFPTVEIVKDESVPLGWKKIVHEAEKGGAEEMLGERMDVGDGEVDGAEEVAEYEG